MFEDQPKRRKGSVNSRNEALGCRPETLNIHLFPFAEKNVPGKKFHDGLISKGFSELQKKKKGL